MNTHNTTAIAVICGKISGNAEAIDIDVKNFPGVDAQLFSAIKDLYPDLWDRLRIHKTPSGGFHIPYKIIDKLPEGNLKLAGLPDPKNEKKPLYYLETRGEGGYILLPPSLGYSVYKDRPWPFLTWEERCSLIAICKSFNQWVKPDRKQATVNKVDDYYDENPFQHFNRSPEAPQVLIEFGWKPLQGNNKFEYYSRPDGNGKNVHATFIRERCLYYFFTTNTNFEDGRCYNPSTVLAQLKFDGDYKKLHKHLVQSGYGRIKSKKEQRIIERNALTGRNAPPNLSQEGQQQLEAARVIVQTKYPHGIFWDDELDMDREGLVRVSACMGFMYHNNEVIQQIGNMLHKRSERYYFDSLKQYIQEEDADISRELHNNFEAFLQKSGLFTITRLPLLDMDKILIDTPTTCWKFYTNCALEIMADGVIEYNYSDVTGLVWAERVQQRSYISGSVGGVYHDFLEKAAEYTKHLRKVIGYLAHEYKDSATGYIIVLTERVDDPTKGGGSGKNLFCDLLGLTTTITSKPGSQVKYDEKFLQSWNSERIFTISDAPKNFDFMFLKEPSTGKGLVKYLFKDERTIDVEDMPKFIIQTNYSYEITDGGLKRRIIPVEFTDFFTLCGGVDVHYGRMFPRDWSLEDWIGYDAIVIESIQEWLRGGRKLGAPELTDTGWRKQFEQTFGHVITEFILANWKEWLEIGDVSLAAFKMSLVEFYEEHGVQRNYQPSSFKINRALREWAEKHGVLYMENHPMRVDGFVCKGKFFGYKAPF